MDSFPFGPPPPPPPPPPPGNPCRRLYIALGIGAGLLVLGGFIAVAVVGIKSLAGAMQEPAKALGIYTDALIRKDYHGAFNIASPGLREATSYPDLVVYHGKLCDRLGALTSVDQTNWSIETKNGVTASTIRATLKFQRGSEEFEFVLHKEQGTWRVFSYKPLSTAGVADN